MYTQFKYFLKYSTTEYTYNYGRYNQFRYSAKPVFLGQLYVYYIIIRGRTWAMVVCPLLLTQTADNRPKSGCQSRVVLVTAEMSV